MIKHDCPHCGVVIEQVMENSEALEKIEKCSECRSSYTYVASEGGPNALKLQPIIVKGYVPINKKKCEACNGAKFFRITGFTGKANDFVEFICDECLGTGRRRSLDMNNEIYLKLTKNLDIRLGYKAVPKCPVRNTAIKGKRN